MNTSKENPCRGYSPGHGASISPYFLGGSVDTEIERRISSTFFLQRLLEAQEPADQSVTESALPEPTVTVGVIEKDPENSSPSDS